MLCVSIIASWSLDSLPHHGAVLTLFAVFGVRHKVGYYDAVMVAFFGALLALAAPIVFGVLIGVFLVCAGMAIGVLSI